MRATRNVLREPSSSIEVHDWQTLTGRRRRRRQPRVSLREERVSAIPRRREPDAAACAAVENVIEIDVSRTAAAAKDRMPSLEETSRGGYGGPRRRSCYKFHQLQGAKPHPGSKT